MSREVQDAVRRADHALPSGRTLTVLVPSALGDKDAPAAVAALRKLADQLEASIVALESARREPATNSPRDVGYQGPREPSNVRPIRNPVTYPIPPSAPQAACRSCHAAIVWIKTPAGKNMPVNPDGVSHFSTCPQSINWKRGAT